MSEDSKLRRVTNRIMSDQGQQGTISGAQATLPPPQAQHHGFRSQPQAADGGQGIGPNRGAHHASSEESASAGNPFSWRGAIKRANISSIFQGINITPNMLFLLLFLGMGLWLWVIYWVRHNEPLANQVLGTTNSSVQAHADRRIVDGIRKAVPIRTGSNTGRVFVPTGNAGLDGGKVYAQPVQVPHGALPLAPAVPMQGQLSSGQFDPNIMHPATADTWQNPPHSAYHVPVQTADGMRLKTITNR